MPIESASLNLETLPAVTELLLSVTNRNWSEDLVDRVFRWRYIDNVDSEGIVAMEGRRCVAMVDSCLRDYMLDGQRVRFRELADWYSLPEQRGAGLQPMWIMMRRKEPMVGMGGTNDTRTLLPRLKWQSMTQRVDHYVLPITSGVLLRGLLKRLPLPGADKLANIAQRLPIPVRRVRRIRPSHENASIRLLEVDDLGLIEQAPLPGYQLVRIVSPKELEWLKSAPPEMGRFDTMLFSIDNQVVGFSVSRLFEQDGMSEAYLLHVQAADMSLDTYSWIVSETAAYLARHGATAIRCRTTCENLMLALSNAGFVKYSSLYPRWWSKQFPIPSGEVMLSWLRGDDGLLPYPSG